MKPVPPHDIVQAVRTELATPGRYSLKESPPAHRSWLQAAWAWIADRFADFERALETRMHVGPAAAALFGDAIVALCVVAVIVVGIRLAIGVQLERARRTQSQPLSSTRDAHAIAEAAARAAAAGDYVRAIRLIFSAAVMLLDLRGLVTDDASATVNELRRAVRERARAAEAPFADLARAYTAAAYAESRVDRDVWGLASCAYETLSGLELT